jgi:hypothetical protein
MKTRKIVWIGSLLIVMLVLLNSCYYDDVIPVEKPVGDVGTIKFTADLVPIFSSSCSVSGCHSAGGQKPNLSASSAFISLTTGGYINKTVPESSIIYQRMKGSNGTPMPVSGSNAVYNAKVLAWIKQGALNN